MNKGLKVFLVIVAVLLVGFAVYFFAFRETVRAGESGPTINVTYENFAEVLSKSAMIQAVPKKSEILIKFYNSDSGEDVVEKKYLLTEGSLTETDKESAELVIWMNSKYISGLTNKNLCSTFKTANQAGDLGIETTLSSASLAWNFKSMVKYKDCF